jgi:hypothetical protein
VDTAAEILGKFVEFGAAIDFNGAFGRVADDVAVMAPLQMFLEISPGVGIHGVVEVIGQLF